MSLRKRFRARLGASAAILATVLSLAVVAPAQGRNMYKAFDSTVGIYNCSASLIQLPEAKDTDQALVMTNGHCIEPVFNRFMERGEVVTNYSLENMDAPYFKEVYIYGGSRPRELARAQLTEIVYATMDDTDLAIIRTDKTYAQLKARGVKIRPFSVERPSAQTPIQIPSTYWNKAYSCQIDGFAHELHEGQWVWKDSIRYTANGCQVQPGSSGAPIINADTGAIIGVNNTYAEGGEACSLSNPCEVDADGNKGSVAERGYGAQTYYIPSCFKGSSLAMDKDGCRLPRS